MKKNGRIEFNECVGSGVVFTSEVLGIIEKLHDKFSNKINEFRSIRKKSLIEIIKDSAINPIDKPKQKKSAVHLSPSSAVSAKQEALTFKEKKELEELPDQIESLETEIAAIHAEMGVPEFYQHSADAIKQNQDHLKSTEALLDSLSERWLELEEKNS